MVSSSLWLFLLLAAVSRVHCVELTQTDSVVLRPGQVLTLSCKISGYTVTDSSYCTGFIRQASGKALEWVGMICGDGSTYYSEKLKSRYQVSRDTSSSTVTLQGQNMQTEDTAVYYCARYGGGRFDYWGKGTAVTVTSAQESAPKSIFGLSQCSSDTEFLTIGCVTRGFSPADSLTFKWTDSANKDLTDFVQYPAFGSDGDYTKISHLRVKKSDWNPQTSYTCEAKNSKGTKETSPMFKKASTGKGPPKVPADEKKFNITIYRPDIINKDSVSLVCEVTSPKPGDVSIMWKVGNEPYTESRINASILREDSMSVLSILTIPKEKYEKPQTTITCAVKHPNMENTSAPLQVTTSKSKQCPECPVCSKDYC